MTAYRIGSSKSLVSSFELGELEGFIAGSATMSAAAFSRISMKYWCESLANEFEESVLLNHATQHFPAVIALPQTLFTLGGMRTFFCPALAMISTCLSSSWTGMMYTIGVSSRSRLLVLTASFTFLRPFPLAFLGLEVDVETSTTDSGRAGDLHPQACAAPESHLYTVSRHLCSHHWSQPTL